MYWFPNIVSYVSGHFSNRREIYRWLNVGNSVGINKQGPTFLAGTVFFSQDWDQRPVRLGIIRPYNIPDIWPDTASLLDSAKLAIQLFYIAFNYFN